MNKPCKHETLTFWSGGYYIACKHCKKMWVATTSMGLDADLDHSRGSDTDQGVFLSPDRVKP